MTTSIQAKLKKSDGQTKIDKIECMHIHNTQTIFTKYQSKNLSLKKLQNRILNMDGHTYILDLNINILVIFRSN